MDWCLRHTLASIILGIIGVDIGWLLGRGELPPLGAGALGGLVCTIWTEERYRAQDLV